jgi:selenoprotein W-related protein
LAAEIQQALGLRPVLVEGSGGVFEIEVDGRPVFSKKRLDRFPDDGEALRLIRAAGPPS